MNWKQNNWARLLLIAEFANKNFKNTDKGQKPFELNCGYHPRVSFEDECDACSRSFLADELATKLRKLMNICCQNLLCA